MNKEQSNSTWTQAIVTLIIGALVTVGATYYTIYEGNKQAVQAEQERFIKVKDNIVSIVEEHIVNQKKVDINSLQRVISIKIKEEKISYPLAVSDILAQAEYNILNSRHLDINKKEEYEKAISEIYHQFAIDSTFDYSKYKESELLQSITNEIGKSNNSEANRLLITLVEKYENEIKSIEVEKSKSEKKFFEFLLEKPSLTIIVVVLYSVFSLTFLTFYRNRLRRRKEELERRKILEKERELIENEIKEIINILESNKTINDVERQSLKEKLKMLEEHLRYIRRKMKMFERENNYH